MNYPEAIEYLLSFADFERSGRFQDRPDVAPMLSLLHRLGDPHLGRVTVHVAGSKGKGSVAAMISSVLSSAHVRAGLFSSPHLHSYCERIRRCERDISEEDFADLVSAQLRPAVDEERKGPGDRQLVTFDLLTALGFHAFQGLQAQVLEVGLGGRVDSTNVFETKEIAVITPISLEHTAILGNTIEAIAREKAAIITPGCAVVMAPQSHGDAERVIREVAELAGAEIVDVAALYQWQKLSHDLSGQEIRIDGPHGVLETKLPLLGRHQLGNAATAFATVNALYNLHPELGASEAGVAHGLAAVQWPGRMEVLRERPLVIADGAHNRDSARCVRETLVEYFSSDGATFIVGCSADKDIKAIAEELAPLARWVIAAQAKHPRAMPAQRIEEAFGALGIEVEVEDSVGGAIDRAMAAGGPAGVICVVGSLFTAAEARVRMLGVAEKRNG